MASKVSMLGQRLRGAQYEVSDLRGNIDRLLRRPGGRRLHLQPRRPAGVRLRLGGEIPRARALRPRRPADRTWSFRRPPRSDCWSRRPRKPGAPIRNRRVPMIAAGEVGARRRRGAALGRHAGNAARQSATPAPACWCGSATRKRSARSAASCRRPTGSPPSAASPAAWRTRSRIRSMRSCCTSRSPRPSSRAATPMSSRRWRSSRARSCGSTGW